MLLFRNHRCRSIISKLNEIQSVCIFLCQKGEDIIISHEGKLQQFHQVVHEYKDKKKFPPSSWSDENPKTAQIQGSMTRNNSQWIPSNK